MKKSIIQALPSLCFVTVIIAISAILEGIISLNSKELFDVVLQKNRILFNENVVKLLLLTLALLPIDMLVAYGKGKYKRKAIVSLKYDFMDKLFNKNINEFQRDNTSKYVSVITNDINTIETSYVDGIYDVIEVIIKVIVGSIVIATVSPLALLAGILISIFSILISKVLSKPLEKHQLQRSNLYEEYTSYIKKVLSAFHIIKTNNLSKKVQKDFSDRSTAVQQKGYVIDKIYAFTMAGYELISQGSFLIIIIITELIAFKTDVSLGGVFLIIMNVGQVTKPIMSLGEMVPRILSTKGLFQKLDDILKNEEEYTETITLEGFQDTIEFENLSFSYEETEVLKDVNLAIKKGGKYLMVGPSGGGKSTVLKLLRKYFHPKTGEILIDNMNLRDVTKRSFFENISNVEQQVFLFEDTLRNNVALYKDYTEEEIETAINRAGLKNFVEGLSAGLDTILFDNGKNISGGEKSRIAIARALLTRAGIIFIDEAFASLDLKVAKEIENTILGLEGITVLNVSHVIFEESKSRYDQIFVVKNKEISCLK